MMKYVFGLAFIIVVLYSTFQDREPEFDFASASLVERTSYLSGRTDKVKARLNSALRQRYGVMRKFNVDTVRLNRGGYLATIAFKDQPPGGNFGKSLQAEMGEALCKSYTKSKSAENKISISVLMTDMNDKTVGQVVLSHSACRRSLATS